MCGNDESIYGNPDTEIGAQYAGLVQQLEGIGAAENRTFSSAADGKRSARFCGTAIFRYEGQALDASEAALQSVPAQLTSGQEQIMARLA